MAREEAAFKKTKDYLVGSKKRSMVAGRKGSFAGA